MYTQSCIKQFLWIPKKQKQISFMIINRRLICLQVKASSYVTDVKSVSSAAHFRKGKRNKYAC